MKDKEAEEKEEAASASEVEAVDLAESQALMEDKHGEAPKTGFVVSLTRRGRFRTLHFIGACHRVPGEHYREFISYGLLFVCKLLLRCFVIPFHLLDVA